MDHYYQTTKDDSHRVIHYTHLDGTRGWLKIVRGCKRRQTRKKWKKMKWKMMDKGYHRKRGIMIVMVINRELRKCGVNE